MWRKRAQHQFSQANINHKIKEQMKTHAKQGYHGHQMDKEIYAMQCNNESYVAHKNY